MNFSLFLMKNEEYREQNALFKSLLECLTSRHLSVGSKMEANSWGWMGTWLRKETCMDMHERCPTAELELEYTCAESS